MADSQRDAAIHRVQAGRALPAELVRLWRAGAVLEYSFERHPELRYPAPTCADEVAVGEEGMPIRLDNPVSPDMLERLRFRSRRGERPLQHVEGSQLKSIVSLQGIYRLSEASAADLETLMLGASA